MSENGYMNSYVKDNDGTGYRDSGFNDNDDYSHIQTDTPDKSKLSPLNITNENKNKKEKCKLSDLLTLNEFMCIINLLASTLGAAALIYPYIIYQIGIISFLLVFIFVSITVYFSLDLLRRFVVDSKLFSFSIITQTTLGNLWLKIYAITCFLFYMSCIVNYLDFLYKYISSMLDFIENGWGLFLYFLISCIVEIILCIFTNKISKIHYLSLIVVGIFFIIIIVLIVNSIIDLLSGDFKSFSFFTIENKKTENNTIWNSFVFIMAKIIEIFYGFIYHSCFPTLLSSLDNIDSDKTNKVQKISYSLLIIIYLFFSFFGCSFYNEKSSLLFEKDVNISIIFFQYLIKSILALLFITLIPIRYIVIRDNYTSLFGQEVLPLKYEILITSICLIMNNLIVCFIGSSDNFINQIMSYFGGAFGVFIAFVLPVISYIALNSKLKCRSIIGYIIASIFIIIGFFSIFYNFQSSEKNNTDNNDK